MRDDGQLAFSFRSGGWLYYTKVIRKTGGEKVVVKTIEEAAAPVATETATIRYKAKNELTFRVLNGSGVAGEAGKVKTALEDLGFGNIETGNAESESVGSTIMTVGSKVAEEEIAAVKLGLKDLLGEIVQKTAEGGEVDILIVTGKL